MFIEWLRWIDSGICAQLPTHSFYPEGIRLPLCARNTGIYLGFLLAVIVLHASKRGRVQQLPPRAILTLLIASVIAMGIDGSNAFLYDLGLPHLYQPQNVLRLVTGLMTGLAMAVVVLPLLNRQIWREYSEERSISSWQALPLYLLVGFVSFEAVISQNGLLLYPIAFASSAGLLLAVSSINLMVVIALARKEQGFERYRELLPFFSLALFLAVGELALLATLKLQILHAAGL